MPALLFDMDHTLIHSAPLWKAGLDALYAHIDRPWDPAMAARYNGLNIADITALTHAHYSAPQPLDECTRVMRAALLAAFREQAVDPMPGAPALLDRLHGLAPMAVASGSPLEAIEIAMDRMGARAKFDVLLSSESVPRGKPHPDVFLAAAEKLNADPAECLVFEDSVAGAQAARAAGMAVFVVPCTPHDAERIPPEARVFTHWDEVSLDETRTTLKI